ncbi:SNF2 family N-terminal domain-containing protein [Hypomontagnella monticulosa]|nr:SNF2 family N-terminal domain-containing protein [Hypomontagnella monticulosa]
MAPSEAENLRAQLWMHETKLGYLSGAQNTPERRAELNGLISDVKHKLEEIEAKSQHVDQDVKSTASKRTYSEHIGSEDDTSSRVNKSVRTLETPQSMMESELASMSVSDDSSGITPHSDAEDASVAVPKDDPMDLDKPPKSEENEVKTPEALRYPLFKHQSIALKWMEDMELDESKRGGILGDDMGLGKTLSTIALMIRRKSDPSSPRLKTNLIVAPVALIKQWQREIKRMIKPEYQLKVFIYHSVRGADVNPKFLSRYDIVLTTYGMLAIEFNKLEKHYEDAKKEGVPPDAQRLNYQCPLLGPNSRFFRIILDEAQCVKNHKSKSAQAVFKLNGKYRWCLTGTPMQNGPNELASLIHFLRIQPYCSLENFKCLQPGRKYYPGFIKAPAMRKLQGLLGEILLRRTKDSEIDGKPIIELKDKIEVIDHVTFDEDQKAYYQALEQNSRVEFSKYLRAGTVGKNYTMVLTLLLRLRQTCCHPYLHLADVEFIDTSAVDDEATIEAAKSLESEVIERIKAAKGFTCSDCGDVVGNPTIMCPCGDYFCSSCLERFMGAHQADNIRAGTEDAKIQCPTCGKDVGPKSINYGEFRRIHMADEIKYDSDDSMDGDSSDDSWDSDGEVDNRGNLKGFVVDNDDDVEYEDEDEDEPQDEPEIEGKGKEAKDKKSKNKKSKDKTKGEKANVKRRENLDDLRILETLRAKSGHSDRARKKYMRYLRSIWEPSAKITKCCELVSNIQETTQEKIIIFSQWTMVLDLLELAITKELGIRVCHYYGNMTAAKRDEAIAKFVENSDIKVILVSLKAGNAGLNLTVASQVIIMEPFWNPYVETQAIDRTYRIGQMKDVTVHRIIAAGTVEDKIITLQEKKRAVVDAALTGGSARGLGTSDLAFLFGVDENPDDVDY